MAKAKWRQYEDARLKKLLAKSRGVKKVSNLAVEQFKENQFYESAIKKAQSGQALTSQELAFIKSISGTSEIQTPQLRRGEILAEQGNLIKNVPLTQEALLYQLEKYSKTPAANVAGDERVVGGGSDFWETQEFKDQISKEIKIKRGGNASVVAGGADGRARITSTTPLLDSMFPVAPKSMKAETSIEIPKARYAFMIPDEIVEKTTPFYTDTYVDSEKYLADLKRGKVTRYIPDWIQKLVASSKTIYSSDEIQAMRDAAKGQGWMREELFPGLASAGMFVSNLFYTSDVTIGGTSEKEWLFGANQNFYISVLRTLSNTVFTVKDWINEMAIHAESWRAEDRAKYMINSAEQARARGDERLYADYMKQANNLLELKKTSADRINIAKERRLASYEQFQASWGDVIKYSDTSKDPPPMSTKPEEYLEWIKARKDEQDSYRQLELKFTRQAYNMYSKITYEETPEIAERYANDAIQFQMRAIEARRKNGDYDAWGAGTWARNPERYEIFIKQAATLELQLGRPLSTLEIRRLKDVYANGWVELSYEVVFDITNLLPIGMAADAIKNSKFYNVVFKPNVTSKVSHVLDMTPVIGWLRKKTVPTVMAKITNTFSDTTQRIRRAYGNMSDLVTDMPKIQQLSDSFKYVTPEVSWNMYKAASDPNNPKFVKGLQNISYNDFRRLADADMIKPRPQWITNMPEGQIRKLDAIFGEFAEAKSKASIARAAAKGDAEAKKKIAKELSDLQNALLNRAKAEIPSLSGLSLKDIRRQFKSADAMSKSTSWGQMLQESVHSAQDMALARLKQKAGLAPSDSPTAEMIRAADALVEDNPSLVLWDYSNKFAGMYRTAHVIWDGTNIADDSITGQFLKLTRILGNPQAALEGRAKVLNPALNLNKWEQWLLEKAPLLGERTQWGFYKIGEMVEAVSAFLTLGREFWARVVLSTPRWAVTNLMDSLGRDFISGGNVADDLLTLVNSTQMHFIDDVGFSHIGFAQQLARNDIPVIDAVVTRIQLGEKPEWGIFSLWKDEYRRLKILRDAPMDTAKMTETIRRGIANRINDRKKSNFLSWIDGFKSIVPSGMTAISDYNTAIEFTLRTRMFHREYFKLIRQLEPEFAKRGIDALSPVTREIAHQIWRESGGNPAKLSALVDVMVGKPKRGYKTSWSYVIPPNSDSLLKNMNIETAESFMYNVRANTSAFIDSTVKRLGREPTADEFKTFVRQMRETYQELTQDFMAQIQKKKTVNLASIDPNKIETEPPEFDKLNGSAPSFDKSESAQNLNKLQTDKLIEQKDSSEILKSSLTPYANVDIVPGSDFTLSTLDGKLYMKIGKDFETNKAVHKEISDAISAAVSRKLMGQVPADMTASLAIKSERDLLNYMSEFLTNPGKLFDEQPYVAAMIARELDNNPGLLRPLRITTKGWANYEEAYKFHRLAGIDMKSLELMNDSYDMKRAFMDLADDVAPVSAMRRASGDHRSNSMAVMLKNASNPAEREATLKLADTMNRLGTEFREFQLWASPGPKRKVKNSADRVKAWMAWDWGQTNMYENTATYLDELNKLSPEKRVEAINKFMENPAESFLNMAGVEITWSNNKTQIAMVKIRREKTTVTYKRGAYIPEYIQSTFFSPKGVTKKDLFYQIDPASTPHAMRLELRLALSQVFGVSSEQADGWARLIENFAQKWGKETGESPGEFFKNIGFHRVNGAWDVPDNTRFLQNGMFRTSVGPDGKNRYVVMGTGVKDLPALFEDTTVMFYGLLRDLQARGSKDADETLEAISKALGFPKGEPLTVPDDTRKFARLMVNFFNEDAEAIGIKLPFEKYSEWMGDYFAAMKNSPEFKNMDTSVKEGLSQMFYRQKTKPVDTKPTLTSAIAKELNIPELTTDDVAEILNPSFDSKTRLTKIKKVGTLEEQLKIDSLVSVIDSGKANAKLVEDLKNVFKLPEAEAKSVGIVTDAHAKAWAALNNSTPDDWYKTHIAGFEAGGEAEFLQTRALPGSVAERAQELGLFPVYNVTSAGGSNSKWATRNLGDALTRVGDSSSQGRQGRTLYVTFVTEDEFQAARQAAVTYHKTKKGIVDAAENEALFKGLNLDWYTDEEAFGQRLTMWQKSGDVAKGGVSFLEDNRAIVHAFERPDVTTAIHELGHVVRRDLPQESLVKVENWAGVVNRKWEIKHEEKWARAIEKYFADGIAPTEELKTVFENIKQWFIQIYKSISGSEIDIDITPEIRKIMDDLFVSDTAYAYPTAAEKLIAEQELTQLTSDLEKRVTDSAILRDLNDAWEVWKTRKDYAIFRDVNVGGVPVLSSMDTLRSHLKDRIKTTMGDLAYTYEKLLVDLETFNETFIRAQVDGVMVTNPATMNTAGEAAVKMGNVDWDTTTRTYLPIHQHMIPDGVKTAVRQSIQSVGNFEDGLKYFDALEEHLINEKYKFTPLSSQAKSELLAWRDEAVRAKADLVSLAINGGEHDGRFFDGAIAKTNNNMLDYTDQNNFDKLIKNYFPFWMFPSRSLPFWTKTMATHPQLISFYNKMQRFSNTERYKVGAVNSKGQPLTSMDGYVPVPGTDLWFNPLAPFSFRYLLDITQSNDDMLYRLSSQESTEAPVESFVARELMELAPTFGFSMAPWIAWMMKSGYNIGDDVMPALPLIPEIPLIPRWYVQDMLTKANTINFYGSGLGDIIYPETSWSDYMVEVEILRNALSDIQTGNPEDKVRIVKETREALKEKGDNEIWSTAYKNVTESDASRALGSFFTGFYTKEFTDAQADLYALRNELNMYKSAMNNEFQAAIFKLPQGAQEKWDEYLSLQDTPEGWIYRLYTDVGWVRNDDGQLVRDKVERNKYLQQAIQDDENQQKFYMESKRAKEALIEKLKDTDIGTPWEDIHQVYVEYYAQLDRLREANPFSPYKGFATNKPAELIKQDLMDDYFKLLYSSRPTQGWLSYDAYQERVTEWELRLPSLAPIVLKVFTDKYEVVQLMQALKPDQIRMIDKNFWNGLLESSNAEGIKEWQRGKDDIFSALNNAWEELYWNVYWDTNGELTGAERQLADEDFKNNVPPPNVDQMYQWIVKTYGPDRFTRDEVIKWMNGGDANVLSIDERTLADKGLTYVHRQEVWDLLSWLSPSKRSKVTDKINEYVQEKLGIEDIIYEWFKHEGSSAAVSDSNLLKLISVIKDAYMKFGIQPPSRELMVKYVEVEQQNNEFKEWVNSKFVPLHALDFNNPKVSAYDELMDLQDLWYVRTGKTSQWIAKHPEWYERLQEYWRMRDAFGAKNPLWREYYMYKPDVPAEFQQIITGVAPPDGTASVPSYTSGTILPSGGGGGGETPSTSTNIPATSIPVEVGRTPWPDNMSAVVGETLTLEVNKLYSDGQKLSSSATQFLVQLRNRHPEWRDFISKTLDLHYEKITP